MQVVPQEMEVALLAAPSVKAVAMREEGTLGVLMGAVAMAVAMAVAVVIEVRVVRVVVVTSEVLVGCPGGLGAIGTPLRWRGPYSPDLLLF